MRKGRIAHQSVEIRRLLIDVPATTLRNLKLLAALRGMTMRDVVAQSLERTISEELSLLLKKEQHQ